MTEDISKIVNRLIKKYDTNDPFDLCKCLDYSVVFCDLPDCTNGFYQHVIRNNIIYINNDRTEREKEVICGHELGHGILHKKTNAIYLDSRTMLKTCIYEKEADRFSAELLIREPLSSFNDLCINQIAASLGVPEHFVKMKYDFTD
ncbi:ImmA/IrrE family metallo-endopeptidase [Eubacteriaceae bacterium ES2]|nr:ImmA/IrrE family metallo-endopeptidase [Eubacteriaceae bacterium ES2]